MKRQILIGLVALLAINSLLSAAQPAYKPGVVLVRFADVNAKPPATTAKNSILNSVFKSSGSRVKREYTLVQGLTLTNLPTGMSVENAVASLRQSPSILYAEPAYKRELSVVPNDTRFGELWGMNNTGQTGGTADADIDAPEAWNISTGSRNIIVAVTDTGVDVNHLDLAANLWHNPGEVAGNGIDDDGDGYIDDVYGVDTGDNDGNPMDDSASPSHGTHVSGTIGAVGNNDRGVAGVCWNVSIMGVKIADANGNLFDDAIIQGIQYAIDKRANVINASWGGYGYSQGLYDVIAAARNAGIVFVAAAHNYGLNNDLYPLYPASFDLDNIISVLATTDTDQMAYYSNYGLMSVDIGAPGGAGFGGAGDILSTLPGGGYGTKAGTSMATPHVAGACALLLSIDPTLTYSQVKQILLDTVDPILPGLCVSRGRMNLAAAAQEAASDTTPPTPNIAGWEMAPQATGRHTIAMEATKTTDRSGVEYYFECVDNNSINSGWVSNPLYKFTDPNETIILPGGTYSFRCKARDKSPQHNETEWSTELSATTCSTALDSLPPAPNPARWAIRPKVQRTGISMKAKGKGTDENGEQFLFSGSFNSGAQSSDTYTVPSSSLTIGQTYHFQVAVMDSLYNKTDWSDDVTVTWATGSRVIPVPSQYTTIQEAIDAANDGDTVEVSPWPWPPYTYRGIRQNNYFGNINIRFNGKAITVRSINPEDPNIVAATIIDCQGTDFPIDPNLPRRAFIFDGGEGPQSILAGFTIRNGYVKGVAGADGGTIDVNDANAGNGGMAAGGAIICGDPNYIEFLPRSPTIRNCVFENCIVEGGDGGNGADGNDGLDTQAPDVNGEGGQEATPGLPGGKGGNAGAAFGGGIYCNAGGDIVSQSIYIQKCIIRGCQALGGIPGNGGNGGDGGNDPNLGPAPGGNGGNGGDVNSIVGGGIFAASYTKPEVIGCTITNCIVRLETDTAVPGSGGQAGFTSPPAVDGNDGIGFYDDYEGPTLYMVGGGGLGYMVSGTTYYISATTFSQNQSDEYGGGAFFWAIYPAYVVMSDCNVVGNDANGSERGGWVEGGGVFSSAYFHGGSLFLYSCDISGNTSDGPAGGLEIFNSTARITDSNVTGNTATYGGGIDSALSDLWMLRSKVRGNQAFEGGGINGYNSSVDITDSEITSNSAIEPSGLGGGLAFWNSYGHIENCVMQSNTAEDVGGAAFLAGWSNPMQFTNCLITNNNASYAGGGLAAHISGWAQLFNCTVADNYTTGLIGTGGGISCEEGMALVELNNSIVSGNSADYGGPQIAVGSYYPTYSDPTADVYVNYTDVEGGEGQIFIKDPFYQAVWWQEGSFDADPLFASTDINEPTYYLSQIAAGQLVNSPCLDAGNDTLAIFDWGALTTRTDQKHDTGTVDLGYHYTPEQAIPPEQMVGKYQLTIQVYVFDPNYGSDGRLRAEGYGDNPFVIFDPNTIDVNQGTVASLTAIPNEGYRVRYWNGTDDDGSTAANNTVTMNSDKTVVVAFEPDGMYFLTVTVIGNGTVDPNGRTLRTPGEVVTLTATPANPSDAIIWTGTDDDNSGSGTNSVTMNGHKDVTVNFYSPRVLYVGGNASYPTIQAAIDDAQERDIIQLMPSSQPYYIQEGLPIIGRNITITSVDPTDPCVVASTVIQQAAGPGSGINYPAFYFADVGPLMRLQGLTIRGFYVGGLNGLNGNPGQGYYDGRFGGSVAAMGIVCDVYASPTIENCVIDNCHITGGNGGNGAGGDADHPNGGNGGWGGFAYGGAVACGVYSSPMFINCTFSNSSAIGGSGGDGGNGAAPPNQGIGGRGGSWYYGYPPPSPWEYGIPDDALPKDYSGGLGGAAYIGFGCVPTFDNCTFSNNISGGGVNGICGQTPIANLRDEPTIRYKIDNLGGAVYVAEGGAAEFRNCTFTGNTADPNKIPASNDSFVGFGGAIAVEYGASVLLDNCQFVNNTSDVGGGLYSNLSYPDINNSSFSENIAYHGGAVLMNGGTAAISGSVFTANEANQPGSVGGAIALLGADAEVNDCNLSDNVSNGSGGGIYVSTKGIGGNDLSGGNSVLMRNCLIIGNSAVQNGAGIVATWHSDPNIVNCTIANNVAAQGIGGGLYSAYGNFTNVINTIFWNNIAPGGPQIAVRDDSNPAYVKVTYSDVEGGAALVRVDPGATLEWDVPTGDPAYPTNIHLDPLFATGPMGEFYLSQTLAGQPQTSPCVDAGSDLAKTLGFALYTTRTDEVPDRTIVDMGYHSPILEPCRFSDLMKDGIINFYDFAILALSWLNEGCGEPNSWCGGADLTADTHVDTEDLVLVTDCWLARDTFAPEPNPSQWAIEPYAASSTSVGMRAVAALDLLWGFPVRYYFECDSGDCNDSGWQAEPTYTDTNLTADTEFSYKVKTRDIVGNETDWSVVRYVTTTVGQGSDTLPPDPNPMTWAIAPRSATTTSVQMRATTALDNSGGAVQYDFNETTGTGHDSGWQSDPCYIDTGLNPAGEYCYRVSARDASNNITGESTEICVSNLGDPEPPTPAPTIIISPDINFVAAETYDMSGQFQFMEFPVDYRYWHKIVVNVAGITDNVTPAADLEVRFICSNGSFSSTNVVPDPITLGLGDGQRGSRADGWRVTIIGSTIVYDVDVDSYSARCLEWTVCVYDAAGNSVCSTEHQISFTGGCF
jgi:subtilisin family serine protease